MLSVTLPDLKLRHLQIRKKALEFYKRLRFEAHAQYKTVTFVEETTYKTEELKEML